MSNHVLMNNSLIDFFFFLTPDSSVYGPFMLDCERHPPRWDTDYLAQHVFEGEMKVSSSKHCRSGFSLLIVKRHEKSTG